MNQITHVLELKVTITLNNSEIELKGTDGIMRSQELTHLLGVLDIVKINILNYLNNNMTLIKKGENP